MANQDSAFGLRAIGKVGQNSDNEGLSEYSIAASATAIYQGDPVKALNTGTIGVAAAGDVLLGSLTVFSILIHQHRNRPGRII